MRPLRASPHFRMDPLSRNPVPSLHGTGQRIDLPYGGDGERRSSIRERPAGREPAPGRGRCHARCAVGPRQGQCGLALPGVGGRGRARDDRRTCASRSQPAADISDPQARSGQSHSVLHACDGSFSLARTRPVDMHVLFSLVSQGRRGRLSAGSGRCHLVRSEVRQSPPRCPRLGDPWP